MDKIKVGVLGATGMVGQRFLTLLENHPFFDVVVLAASKRNAGKKYIDAMQNRWAIEDPMPNYAKDMVLYDLQEVEVIADKVDLVFSAVDMKKNEIIEFEEKYAKSEVVVVSNNSATRNIDDVPMVIPEINDEHLEVIATQKKRLGTKKGFIVVKPNCSIQSYTPQLYALKEFEPYEVVVSTYQAISGAGKTFDTWEEMVDNIIPFISGEEEKSEKEPLKIFGKVVDGKIVNSDEIKITTQCIRVPVSNGHTATVFVKFRKKPSKEQILSAWENFSGKPQQHKLPHAPERYIHYFEEENRPQAKVDRMLEGGMAVCSGRLREDSIYDYKFVGLSHNTLRGAAGGAVLIAELIVAEKLL